MYGELARVETNGQMGIKRRNGERPLNVQYLLSYAHTPMWKTKSYYA